MTHTQQTLLELSQTESLVKDAETGQRGFLYTGDPKYLAPYDLAVGEVTGHIDRLAELTAGQSWAAGAHFGAARFGRDEAERAGADDLLLPGGEARVAKALVLSDDGRLLMTQIRSVTEEMVREEDSLWTARSAKYQRSVRVTIACIYLASGLAVLGWVFCVLHSACDWFARASCAPARGARRVVQSDSDQLGRCGDRDGWTGTGDVSEYCG